MAMAYLRTRHLPDGNVEAVEHIGDSDHDDDGGQAFFVEVLSGLIPDRVGNRISLIGEPGSRLSERKGGSFGVGKVGSFPPCRHREEALICFACLFRVACTIV